MNFHPTIRAAPHPWYGIQVPYDPAFVDELSSLALWDKASSTWWFPEPRLPVVQNLASRYWPELVTAPVTPATKKSRAARCSLADEAYEILGVSRSAPDSVLAATCNALLKEFAEDGEKTERIRWAYGYAIRERGL